VNSPETQLKLLTDDKHYQAKVIFINVCMSHNVHNHRQRFETGRQTIFLSSNLIGCLYTICGSQGSQVFNQSVR